MRLFHVPVESFQVELEFAQVFRLELFDLEFKCHEAVERPVEEQQVDDEVTAADLDRVLAPNEAEVAAEFVQELLELLDQGAFEVGLGMPGRQVYELDEIAVLEDGFRLGVSFSHRRCEFRWSEGHPLK